jgi:hypothetical protein
VTIRFPPFPAVAALCAAAALAGCIYVPEPVQGIRGLFGFAATLSREDGTRMAHAAVLAAQTREGLRFALVLGESREGVRMMAREVAGKLK